MTVLLKQQAAERLIREEAAARSDEAHRQRMHEIRTSSSNTTVDDDPFGFKAQQERDFQSREAEKQRQHELELARIAAGQSGTTKAFSSTASSSNNSAVSSSSSTSKRSGLIIYYGMYFPVRNGELQHKDSIPLFGGLDTDPWGFGLMAENADFVKGHPFRLKSVFNETKNGQTYYRMSPIDTTDMFTMTYDNTKKDYVAFASRDANGDGWVFFVKQRLPKPAGWDD